ncbi:hypothetical protein BGZ93_005482 [Podila epicladia]|nr:hypothetical protein BGZ92_005390 [Podila epicladia]KAG0099878.1 hypothetical protein BGZ93_005482 [Podila epicladia]
MSEAQIAHRRLIQSLYKRALRTAQDTNLFRRKDVELRIQLDAYKNTFYMGYGAGISNSHHSAHRILIYNRPIAPVGAKFERNVHADSAEPAVHH